MKKGIAIVLALAVIGGAGFGGYYYSMKESPAGGEDGRVSSESDDAVYVDSVSDLAGLGSGNGLIQRFAGVIEPQKTWEVKLEGEKKVGTCYVKEGDKVKNGDKLFDYDTTEDEDKLEQSQIDLERIENEITSAKERKASYEKQLSKAKGDDILTYTTQVNQEEVAIKTAEYEYKSKELEIKQLNESINGAVQYCEMDGTIKSINNTSGSSSFYDTQDSPYLTVIQDGVYRVKGKVNEQNRSQLYEGTQVIVHSRVDETLTWYGEVTEVQLDKPESNSDSGYGYGSGSDNGNGSSNYPFYVQLENSDGLILGQHVYLEPNLGQDQVKEGIWLDSYYFDIKEDGSAFVWTASSANVLEYRQVTLGEYDEELDTWQVLEGLGEDDYIAMPDDILSEGMPVIYNDFSSEDLTYDDMDLEGDYSDEYNLAGDDFDFGIPDDGDVFADFKELSGGFYDADSEDDFDEIDDFSDSDEGYEFEDVEELGDQQL